MTHESDVCVGWGRLVDQSIQRMLGVRTVYRQGLFDLFVDADEDLDALFGLSLQDLIQSPFFVLKRGSA